MRRTEDGVRVLTASGHQLYQSVVVATNARIACSLIENPTTLEQACLSAFSFHNKTIMLHADRTLFPRSSGTWNVQDVKGRKVASYDLSKIHTPLRGERIFSSWGDRHPHPSSLIAEQDFEHPCFSKEAGLAQGRLSQLNQDGRIVYCGAYFGSGFHEDGCRSAHSAVRAIKDRVIHLPRL